MEIESEDSVGWNDYRANSGGRSESPGWGGYNAGYSSSNEMDLSGGCAMKSDFDSSCSISSDTDDEKEREVSAEREEEVEVQEDENEIEYSYTRPDVPFHRMTKEQEDNWGEYVCGDMSLEEFTSYTDHLLSDVGENDMDGPLNLNSEPLNPSTFDIRNHDNEHSNTVRFLNTLGVDPNTIDRMGN